MEQLNKKLLILYTIILLAAGWSGWGILQVLPEQNNLSLYPVIPVFFWILGVVTIYTLTHINRDNPRKVTNIYMIFKLMKFILSAIFVVIILSVANESPKVLLLTFAAYYFIYILCEVLIYSKIEKADKAEKRHA